MPGIKEIEISEECSTGSHTDEEVRGYATKWQITLMIQVSQSILNYYRPPTPEKVPAIALSGLEVDNHISTIVEYFDAPTWSQLISTCNI